MSDTQKTATTRAFDAAASDFDDLGHYLWNPIGAATVEATGPGAGDRVLDACCGVGASAIPAATRVGPEGRVDAVDLSAPMIDELTRLGSGLPQLHAIHADATTWATDGYDVVQSALGIFFFPDMAAGTDWLVSRARPGGRVGLTIWRRGSVEAAGQHLGRAVADVTRTEPTRRPSHPIDDINQPAQFQAWLTERGLTEVAVITHELHLPMTPDVAWLVITGSGYAGALSQLNSADAERVRVAYLESLQAENVNHLDATTLIGIGTRPSPA